MRILFMGTPDFALFSLRALVDAGEDVVGVVTQPDQPKGRGYVLTPPPVKVYATEHGIPVYQPETLKNNAFLPALSEISPDLVVVTAYGKILPPYVLELPKYGCINVHASLLPAYRGAAPIQRAIMDGQKETGITIMRMAQGLDTGDMMLQAKVPIDENDNFETVHDHLGQAGASILIEAIQKMKAGTLRETPQDDRLATYASKIEKADCRIDFSQSSEAVHNLIRGLSPVPLATTVLPNGKLLKIVRAEKTADTGPHDLPGQVLSTDGGAVTVACGQGSIRILELVPEGKSRMSAAAFLNGRKIAVGDRIGSVR